MQSRKILKIGFFIILTLGFQRSIVNATVVKKLSEEELAREARTILIGTCTSIKSEWNEERTKIFTYIRISPQNFLKGEEIPEEITIQQLGGEVGEIGMRVDETSVFEEGEEVLLFLKRGRKGLHRILGLSQGKFSVKTDPITERKILFRKRVERVRTRHGIEKKIVEIGSDKKLFLDEFINKVQDIIQQRAN